MYSIPLKQTEIIHQKRCKFNHSHALDTISVHAIPKHRI